MSSPVATPRPSQPADSDTARPVLERAATPPPQRWRSRRMAMAAGSLGILALAASLGLTLVDLRIEVAPPLSAMPPATLPSAARGDSRVAGRIQVALLLDTSGSMDGLIEQARSQLWKIVTRLDAARRAGKRPAIEIALYEYGNTARAGGSNGWIRQITPFTTDLDLVSESLFSLTVTGSQEYVGHVIATAVSALEWSEREGDLKLLFVAGNEQFDQGPVAPHLAMEAARAKGIAVTAILCGDDDPSWKVGSRLANIGYFQIDADQRVAHVSAPQDSEIARLGVALNETYIAYGADGGVGAARQVAEDENAHRSQPGAQVWRSVAKSSGSYDNGGWDLVDGVRGEKVALDKLAEQDLPPSMRAMTAAQRHAYVEERQAERLRIQRRIQQLNRERDRIVASPRWARASPYAGWEGRGDHVASLDSAMLQALTTQAATAGFRFE